MSSVKFQRRDSDNQKNWDKGKNKLVVVNESQYSLDTIEREREFFRLQYDTPEDYQAYLDYRKEWFRRANEFDAGDFPLAVGVELVSSCNLNCTMCYTITEEFQGGVIGAQRVMPWPIVKAIIDEAAEIGVFSMLFSWRGESSLYRSRHEGKTYRMADVFAYAKEKGIPERTVLSNGQLVDRKMAEELVAAQPSWINFSIDGLAEEYNKIRTPKNKQKDPDFDAFELVMKNIRQIVEIRDSQGLSKPQIRTNTIFPAIARDPKAYLDTMTEAGVGWVTVNEILDFRGSDNDGGHLPEDAVLDEWACQYPFQRLMISANGIVLPCTGAHNEEQGLVLGRYLGTPPKQVKRADGIVSIAPQPTSLKDAWNSPKVKKIREMHASGNRCDINPGCRDCRHGAKKYGVEWVPDEWDMETMLWKGRKFRNG